MCTLCILFWNSPTYREMLTRKKYPVIHPCYYLWKNENSLSFIPHLTLISFVFTSSRNCSHQSSSMPSDAFSSLNFPQNHAFDLHDIFYPLFLIWRWSFVTWIESSSSTHLAILLLILDPWRATDEIPVYLEATAMGLPITFTATLHSYCGVAC